MKKITLISILAFVIIIIYIFIISLAMGPSTPTYSSKIFNQPLVSDSNNQIKVSTSSKPILDKTEVLKHSTPGDCYLLINNNIYDVSSYISFHPGGSRQITSRCGKEVSGIFARIHSNRTWDLLAKYKIGTINIINSSTNTSVEYDLAAIEEGFKKANPNVEIVSVKPKSDFYIAKVIFNKKLYEVHINKSGKIIQEEIESDEFDWLTWDTDEDD